MSTAIGGWYLNNRGVLEYRLLDEDSNQTTTVLASVSGLTNIINGTGNDEGKVMVKKTDENGNTSWAQLSATDITIESESGNGTADSKGSATSIKIGSSILGTAKVAVAGSANYTVGALDFIDQNSRVHLKEAETITYNSTAGTATVTGKLTAGFTVNGLTATYSAATAADKTQTLATISGLAKGYSDSTVALTKKTEFDVDEEKGDGKGTGAVTAGTITLSKTSTAGEVSALGTTAIKVVMDKTATANGLNYYLAFGNKTGEDYAQVAANDEPAYWSLNKTTATYQYYSPTGYQLANAKGELTSDADTVDKNATQVKITPAKTTVVATVTGLAADLTTNITDNKQYPKEVGTGQARLTTGDNKFVSGITITADVDKDGTGSKPTYKEDGKTLDDTAANDGKGTVTINVTRSVLPTKGTVTVTAGKDFTVETTTDTTTGTNDFHTKAQADEDAKEGTADKDKVVKDQYIWVISGNKAIYEKVDLAYYERTDQITDRSGNTTLNKDKNGNKITRIICTPQGKPTVLATITGLDADYLENEANLTRNSTDTTIGGGVITHIKGINVALEGTPAEMDGRTVKTPAVPGEIMLSKEVLGTTNVALAKSDNYRLSLATETLADGTKAVDLPGFKNYKWNLVGTTATLKGTVTAGYTASDDGKLITYTAAGDNQTLATVAGLKKGTQLNKSATGDNRTIGNYIGGYTDNDFVDGLAIQTDSTQPGGSLSHKTGDPGAEKTLVRMPITLSKHVMDGKVTLNSNFFTLAINQDTTGFTDKDDIAEKAASRTYVLTKDELYDKKTDIVNGKEKVTYTEKEDAQKLVGWYGALGSTVTLRQNTPPCYELVTDTYGTTKTINYTAAPKTSKLLATVTGLNPSVTENDISFDATTDKVITIKNANALTTSNVKITGTEGYKLAMDSTVTGLGAASLGTVTWTQAANGTVSYKADVTRPGYKLNADANTITYTKATTTTAATLATITGLKTGLSRVESSAGTGNSGDGSNSQGDAAETEDTNLQFNGVVLDPDEGTITLSKSALGTTKVVLSGDANYKLKLASDVVQEKKADLDRWVISGTNAIFKRVTPDYYTLTDNTVIYNPTVDVKYTTDTTSADYDKSKAGKAMVYGTIQGLKSGLSVSDDGKSIGYYGEDGKFVEAITFGTGNDAKIITINNAGVLNNTTVKLDATAIAEGYKIELSSALVESKKPALVSGSEPEWSISRGTATYKGNIEAGYSNNSSGTSIDYSAAKTGATIATITGLNTTLTSVGDDDLKFGTGDDTNVITVTKGMLGTTDAKLTTNIAILGKDYKLALDAYDKTSNPTGTVTTADTVESKEIWTIDSSNANTTTATYGTWKDTHYTLNDGQNEASDTITYHKAGVADTDKIATVSGLAGNIVTVKDDQINGITVTAPSGSTSGSITLSSSVLPTTVGSEVTLTKKGDDNYDLVLNATEVESKAIPIPRKDAIGYKIEKGTKAEVSISRETSAGFVYDGDDAYNAASTTGNKTKLVYKKSVSTATDVIGTVSGLSKNIEKNSEGGIDGITITTETNNNTTTNVIVLGEAVLDGEVTLVSDTYELRLDSSVTASESNKTVWEADSSVGRGQPAQFKLYIGGANSGYQLNAGNQSISYNAGNMKGNHVATITGLKNTDKANVTVDTENKKIIISAGALNAQEVSITPAEGYTADDKKYTLALNNPTLEEGEEKPDGYVEASKSTNAWDLTNGTATFTQTVTAGYAMNGGKVVYTPASSIVSTFTNFSKEAKIIEQDDDTNTLAISKDITASLATYKGITFKADKITAGKGTFTISDANLLAHKNVKLTTRATGTTADYTIALGSGVAAKVDDPVWNKAENATVATYTQTTAAGYSLDSTNKNITYSSDPTTVTLATVSGLNKESVVNSDGTAVGIETTTTTTDNTTDPPTTNTTTTVTAGLEVTKSIAEGNGTGEITISGNVLNNAKVTLGRSDNYKFALDKTVGNEVHQSDVAETQVWAQNRTTAIYKNVKPAYYGLDATEKIVNYTPQADANVEGTSSPNIVTISGLKGGITINADGTVKNADGTSSAGLTASTSANAKAVTLSSAVLGTTKIVSDSYRLYLDTTDDNIITASGAWEGQTEWVDAGRGSYTYKKYNKAYYYEDNEDTKVINYEPAKDITAYATVSGLQTGLTNANIGFAATDSTDYSKGGKLTLGASQLGTGTVKLTTTANATGDFTLALDTDASDDDDEDALTKAVTESTIKENSEEWTTKTTVATLTGLKQKGYTLSEDKKSITYQADDKTVTLATVKGIKSGAEIALTDVKEGTGDDEGKKIITLSASQLGTSNVTVTGDGYKLALAADAVSQTDDAAWVKAANATKATFTQTTYRGFREATDGKSLIYQKNTGNVDLATINGLSKTLTADDMAIAEDATELAAKFATGALVVVNTATNEIYLAKDALNASAVTLGNADNYKLKLYDTTEKEAVTSIGGDEAQAGSIVFDKSTGTMSIVSGKGAIWEETANGKSLTYTKDTYKTAATITGLPKDLTFTENETTGTTLEGITVAADGTITIGKAAVFKTEKDDQGKTIVTTESRLAGGSKIVLTNNAANGGNYTLEVSDDSDIDFEAVDTTPPADKTKWVATTRNLSLKEVTSAHYLKSTVANKNQEVITYVAEKVGGDLAVITGLPTGITVSDDGSKVNFTYTDSSTAEEKTEEALQADTTSKKIDILGPLANNVSTQNLTITIAALRDTTKQYTFNDDASTAAIMDKQRQYDGDPTTPKFTFDNTKGTGTYGGSTTAGWQVASSTQVKHIASSTVVSATINGLKKGGTLSGTTAAEFKDTHDIFANDDTFTVNASALTNSNVTITMPKGYTEPYNLALGSDVNSTANSLTASTWQGITNWAVAGGTATYKTYDEANYYIKAGTTNRGVTTPNSIIYVAPTKGTAYASITGLNKTITSVNQAESVNAAGELIITLGANELEGTTKVVLANGGAKSVSAGKNMTPDDADKLNTKIAAGNATAAKFKLALDATSDNNKVTTSGIENAVWDNNGKVATLTGTITKGYRLSNDQKTVTYQSADSRLQTIAKVTGIKSGSQISDSNVAALTSGATGYNENLPNLQYITLKGEHLGTDNVVLTGEGYKLALDAYSYDQTEKKYTGSVITNEQEDLWKNQTEWVNNNGTFVYKTYNKGYYTLDDTTGMRVTYTKPVDDLKTAGTQHKTYLTIAGLSRTADATVLGEAGTVSESSGTITVKTKEDGVISLSDAALNKQNVKLTDNLNGGYSLSIANITDSLKSTVSNDSAVISGTKATWTGTQGKGYLLTNDDQNITYYSAAKAKQTIATVTGLASGITSAKNDEFSGKYTASNNTVTLKKDDLSTNVVIGGTAAFKFDDFTGGIVTGSAAADKMTFGAGGNSINAAGGNDIITVTGGNNTFLYANGNGNDVITGFTAATETDGGDILKVTNVVGTTSTSKKVGDDTVYTYTNNIEVYQDDKIVADTIVRVNKNYIRLKGVQAGNVTVEDKNGDKWNANWTHDDTPNGSFIDPNPPATDSGNVFADDNYAMTPNLSSIVKSSTASYSADDLVDDDATSLTKQSTAVSYSDKK